MRAPGREPGALTGAISCRSPATDSVSAPLSLCWPVAAAANVCYLLATRTGLFGLAVVITALYPGITVLLARLVPGERMRSWPRVGLVLAGAGLVLVTI